MRMIQTTQQTSFDWETATLRERDIWIAEHVFGFEWWRSSATGRRGLFPAGAVPEWFHERADMAEAPCHDHPTHVPHYTSDPASDLSVLHAMRSRDRELIEDYFDILVNILHDRWRCSEEGQRVDFDCCWLYPVNFYEVGDYSRAAWLTLKGQTG